MRTEVIAAISSQAAMIGSAAANASCGLEASTTGAIGTARTTHTELSVPIRRPSGNRDIVVVG